MSWEHYTTAVVRVSFPGGDVEIRPAPVSWTVGTFPEVEGHTIHIVTAYNPGGRAAPSAANEEAHRRLQAQVAATGLMWWPAAVADPTGTHVELSVAVAGLDDDGARTLGAAHGQEAIFAWRPNAWIVLSCTDVRAHLTGWATRDTGHLSDESTTPTAAHDREPPSAAAPTTPDRPARRTEVRVPELSTSTGTAARYPDSWLEVGGYLDRLAHRRGRLVSIRGRHHTLEYMEWVTGWSVCEAPAHTAAAATTC